MRNSAAGQARQAPQNGRHLETSSHQRAPKAATAILDLAYDTQAVIVLREESLLFCLYQPQRVEVFSAQSSHRLERVASRWVYWAEIIADARGAPVPVSLAPELRSQRHSVKHECRALSRPRPLTPPLQRPRHCTRTLVITIDQPPGDGGRSRCGTSPSVRACTIASGRRDTLSACPSQSPAGHGTSGITNTSQRAH